MDGHQFRTKSVKELQQYLKDRGVIFSDQRKPGLVELCECCEDIGIEIDPDGLFEDREEVLSKKLTTNNGKQLENPENISGSQDLTMLPPIGIFDLYNYLISFDHYDNASLRNYYKMEGYGMFEDGYVLSIEVCLLDQEYVSLKSKVKPRTKENDPVSKLGYYKIWIIFSKTSEAGDNGTPIHSALCTCKGGMDGGCRHIVATLFEVIDFLNDKSKASVTSGPCMWLRRSSKSTEPVLITELDTRLTEQNSPPKPLEDVFIPNPPDQNMPCPQSLIDKVREIKPEACLLDAWEVRQKQTIPAVPLDTTLPSEKIKSFWTSHVTHKCSDVCYNDFLENMRYTSEEIVKIETGTRGQHENINWKLTRDGVLTSSNFKKVCHSTDFEKTANAILTGPTFAESDPPEPVLFGRNNENKAREMFLKSHRYHHRKCKKQETGLIISYDDPILATSPDGIIECSICGPFLIEIKCLYTNRNFYPKPALLASKICEKNDDGNLNIVKTHQYNYQIQGQMSITSIHKCVLVGFTRKGIFSVKVNFDEKMWNDMRKKLYTFYRNSFLPQYLNNNGITFEL